ncbi:hypothetical protein EVAR_66903_1 [Eumeta japonica]|uniref:Uncharacterized protein n=1 Tax=Eumeta variegata TaxID=151549 RepID=A0A4C1Z959_EUMVA|nr:hypothetical protein EVAR_66903_1 [Eumeta japonica]
MHWRGGVVIEREGMRERKERGGKRKLPILTDPVWRARDSSFSIRNKKITQPAVGVTYERDRPTGRLSSGRRARPAGDRRYTIRARRGGFTIASKTQLNIYARAGEKRARAPHG